MPWTRQNVSAAAPAVLQFNSLNVSFTTPTGEIAAVRDFSLSLTTGECVGIVGTSGAGKSQAFLAALGLLARNGRAGGEVSFAGMNLLQQTSMTLNKIRATKIAMVLQDSMGALTPHLRIGEQIAEPLKRHLRFSRRAARRRALELIERVQLADPQRLQHRYPHELSGGMRQRVMIAMALACQPSVLIADEPTTALDTTIQAQILALFADLKRDHGLSMVVISHDIAVIAGLCDYVAVMDRGSIVERGTIDEVLKTPVHPCTRALLRDVPRIGSAGPIPGEVSISADAILQVADLNVNFRSSWNLLDGGRKLRALAGIQLRLHRGQALAVVGESGCGKSTLARAIVQLIRPAAGRVIWSGRVLGALAPEQLRVLRRELQMVFQDPTGSLDPRMTVAAIVAEPLRSWQPRVSDPALTDEVRKMLERVGLTVGFMDRYPHELSGGECQRVALARALIVQPQLLICDEPLSALDVSTQARIVEMLQELKREHRLGILFVSHNLAVIRNLCEQVLVLYRGRMMELAPAEEFYRRPLHPYSQSLLDAVPVVDPGVQPARWVKVLRGEPSAAVTVHGCAFQSRCPYVQEICRTAVPPWESVDARRHVACHRWRDLAGEGTAGRTRDFTPGPRTVT